MINASQHAGGSSIQDTKPVVLPKDDASVIIPRLIYAIVCASAVIAAALLVKSAVTGGDAVVPQLSTFA